MIEQSKRCPNCQSDNTVIEKIPGEENTYLFICDSCFDYQQIYLNNTGNTK